jgi:hypothetical protein
MLRGQAEPRDDIPCTTCDIYQTMRRDGACLSRPDIARGQRLDLAEALTAAADFHANGRIDEATRMCRTILAVEPAHAGALLLLYRMEATRTDSVTG